MIACLLVSYYIIPVKDEIRRGMWLSGIGLLMISAVLFGGMISGFVIEKNILNKSTKIGQTWGGIAASILISPLSLYYGMASSPLGLWVWYWHPHGLGIGHYVGYIGIFIAVTIFIIIIECIAAVIGFFLGSLLQNLIQRVS